MMGRLPVAEQTSSRLADPVDATWGREHSRGSCGVYALTRTYHTGHVHLCSRPSPPLQTSTDSRLSSCFGPGHSANWIDDMNDGKGALLDHSGRHSLRFERLLTHPPDELWSALTEIDELSVWFPAKIEGPREPGASLRFVFPPEPGQVPADSTEEGATMSGEMLVFDSPQILEYTWEDDVLRWELDPRADGTLLTFTHTFADKARAAREASGWTICLESLEASLASLPVEPFTTQRFDALFEDYARRFGPAAAVLSFPPT